MLEKRGRFATIIPFKEEERFLELAVAWGLSLRRRTRVKGTPKADFKRVLLEFSNGSSGRVREDTLVIELERHRYTPEYISLTRDFYLNME